MSNSEEIASEGSEEGSGSGERGGGELWDADEYDGRLSVVLSLVLARLAGRALAAAGAVSRAWRRAAAQPRLYRRLLAAERRAHAPALRALTVHLAQADEEGIEEQWSWRAEYVVSAAGWRHVCELRAPLTPLSPPASPVTERGGEPPTTRGEGPGAALLHAEVSPDGDAIAVAAEDATISVWVRDETAEGGWAWRCGVSLRRRGWRAAARVQWAGGADGMKGAGAAEGGRLLAAGPLVLAARWELAALELAPGGGAARVLARAGCSAGAAGCWAGPAGAAFLALELRLLAPGRALTTLWINSATQETESEFTGVAAPILRIYNEGQAHISHVVVVEIPEQNDSTTDFVENVDTQYLRATRCASGAVGPGAGGAPATVVAACGAAGGARGVAAALAVWPLRAVSVPAVVAAAGGGLAERVARRRRAPRVDDPAYPPPPPSEDELRALCTPPRAKRNLHHQILGLVPHHSGRCIWAADASGCATCVSLPALAVLRVLQPAPPGPHTLTPRTPHRPHYVQPALSEQLLVSPLGDISSRVCAWSARSGASVRPPPPAGAPTVAALLPPAPPSSPPRLLLLAGAVIHENFIKTYKSVASKDEKCGLQRDRVGERHQAALAHRRAEYLREVAARRAAPRPRPAPPAPPPNVPVVRTTEGRYYKLVACQPAPQPSACGPCRRPPPPQLLALEAFNKACEIKGPGYADLCAHQPKIVMRIDRSQTHEKGGKVDLTPSKPQKQTDHWQKPVVGGAKYVGDSGWCSSLPPPAEVPCGAPAARRPPACRDFRCGPRPLARRLHSAAASRGQDTPAKASTNNLADIATQTKENAKKFESMLMARHNLKETARGRVVTSATNAKNTIARASGGLEMAVPPGATSVKVCVSLGASPSCTPRASRAPRAHCTPAPAPAPDPLQSPCGARAAVTAACSTPLATPAVVSRAVPCEVRVDLSSLQPIYKNTSDAPSNTCKEPCRPKPLPCLTPKSPKGPCENPATTSPKGPCPPAPRSPPKKDPSKGNPCAPTKQPPCKKGEKKKPPCSSGGLAFLASVCDST